jgi:hypothetical protein
MSETIPISWRNRLPLEEALLTGSRLLVPRASCVDEVKQEKLILSD